MAVDYLAGSVATVLNATSAGASWGSYTYDSGSTGADRCLVVSVGHENGISSPTGITYGGVALTLQRTVTAGAGDNFSETIDVWTLTNPATGSNTLALSGTAGSQDAAIYAAVYTGVDQATPIGNTAINSALGPTAAASTTIVKQTEDNGLVWAFAHDQGASVFAAEASNTLLDYNYTALTGSAASTFGIGCRLTGNGAVLAGAVRTGGNAANQPSPEDNGVVVVELIAASAGPSPDSLNADDLESTSTVSTPSVAQTHNLSSDSLDSKSAVSTPTVVQTHQLTPLPVESPGELTQPSLSSASTVDSLTASDISSASQVSESAIGQIQNIAANGAESTSEASAPTLNQTHDLTSVSLQSLSQVSSSALTSVAGQDSLAANDVESASALSSPAIAQAHVLQPAMVESGTETSSTAIAQVHSLNSASASSASTASSPTLRDASQVLASPIKNTKATVSQSSYRAIAVTATYKAAIIQTDYKAEVA